MSKSDVPFLYCDLPTDIDKLRSLLVAKPIPFFLTHLREQVDELISLFQRFLELIEVARGLVKGLSKILHSDARGGVLEEFA
jgi:hypothetical protein